MSGIIILAAVYGTLVGGDFAKAPDKVEVDGYWRGSAFITEPQANALGYKLLIDERPACASNEYAVATGYDYDSATSGMRIRRVYEKRTVVPPARRWTPLSIKRSAAKLGYWDALRAFLVSASLLDDYLCAQYLAEDDADFMMLLAAARQKFGDSVVDAILNGAEVEP